MDAPRYSLALVHDERRYPDAALGASLASIEALRGPPRELLLLHDGPPARGLPNAFSQPTRVQATAQRLDDGGHALRDHAARIAQGEYLIHLARGDLLHPNALVTLDAARVDPPVHHPSLPQEESLDVLVFAVLRRGVYGNGAQMLLTPDRSRAMIFSGFPTLAFLVDPMQVVVARRLWPALGPWRGIATGSAGVLYERLVAEHGARYIPEILGEK
jgi:hypothetical protein